MEVFCISNLVNSVMEADEEFIVLDVHFAVTDGSMEAMFEMLHEFLTAPRCVQNTRFQFARRICTAYRFVIGCVYWVMAASALCRDCRVDGERCLRCCTNS